ncbi:four helix bundle protein [Jiulongibacter sediminis]|uniref:Four helix bundle protein n=1 Tax=Jiulongibacter sediminis TaxID=1605367 RepID=A0A0P7BM73_9BACT|nr:four helix bundle protein [Jiulongibacter sediminis]KPM48352.1 hypothetical protein AFM12_06810 [Jiulongibacter sediminis]TBX24889.1 hypothetical protein TK44_06815 [Jiulongibacter sediminis]
MTQVELKKRFFDWSVQTVFFLRKLPDAQEYRVVNYQLSKSSSSSAANYRAVCRGKSRPDFLNKLRIVEEELDESLFWLEYINAISSEKFIEDTKPLLKEGDELLSIIVASIKTVVSSNKNR